MSAAARGEAARAARLFGAAAALHESAGIPAANDEQTLEEPYMLEARSQLDKDAWDVAWEEGRTMSMETAIEYALSEDASTKLKPLAPDRQPADARPSYLTPREQEIAALVARGMTNRQIASELVLSEHTVATHLRRTLKKLDFRSRAELAAWVSNG